MSILAWIILGGLAGALASHLSGRDSGCLMSVALGVVGAMVGGAVFRALGGAGVSGCNVWSLAVATVGALILLALARLFSGRH